MRIKLTNLFPLGLLALKPVLVAADEYGILWSLNYMQSTWTDQTHGGIKFQFQMKEDWKKGMGPSNHTCQLDFFTPGVDPANKWYPCTVDEGFKQNDNGTLDFHFADISFTSIDIFSLEFKHRYIVDYNNNARITYAKTTIEPVPSIPRYDVHWALRMEDIAFALKSFEITDLTLTRDRQLCTSNIAFKLSDLNVFKPNGAPQITRLPKVTSSGAPPPFHDIPPAKRNVPILRSPALKLKLRKRSTYADSRDNIAITQCTADFPCPGTDQWLPCDDPNFLFNVCSKTQRLNVRHQFGLTEVVALAGQELGNSKNLFVELKGGEWLDMGKVVDCTPRGVGAEGGERCAQVGDVVKVNVEKLL